MGDSQFMGVFTLDQENLVRENLVRATDAGRAQRPGYIGIRHDPDGAVAPSQLGEPSPTRSEAWCLLARRRRLADAETAFASGINWWPGGSLKRVPRPGNSTGQS